MGGNALKNITTVRKNKEDFLVIEKEVVDILKNFFPDAQIKPLLYYKDKQTFGDLDILFSESHYKQFVNDFWIKYCQKNKKFKLDEFFERKSYIAAKSLMQNILGSKDFVHDFPMFSTDYKQKDQEGSFQIDIITVKDEVFDFAYSFLNYNDLGSLIGSVATKMGLKFGSNGLNYHLTVNGKFLDQINITNNFNEAIEFLGFDSERYKQGFTYLNDVYEYVISSKYFNPNFYKPENRNSKQKHRDKNRANYVAFYNLVKDMENKHEFPDKETWFNKALETFPDFKQRLEQRIQKEEDRKLVKTKINGKIISDITGIELNSIELGLFINDLKLPYQYNTDKFEEKILTMSQDDIKEWILDFYKNTYNKKNFKI